MSDSIWSDLLEATRKGSIEWGKEQRYQFRTRLNGSQIRITNLEYLGGHLELTIQGEGGITTLKMGRGFWPFKSEAMRLFEMISQIFSEQKDQERDRITAHTRELLAR